MGNVNRKELIRILEGLDSTSFSSVVLRIEGGSQHDNLNVPVIQRVAYLLTYVESSIGPGLDTLASTLVELFPRVKSLIYSLATSSLETTARISKERAALITPGGTVNFASPFYVQRMNHESTLLAEAYREQGIAVLRGARQTGKSTLLSAMCLRVMERGSLRPVSVDFQRFESRDFTDERTVWKAVASRIARTLQIRGWRDRWDDEESLDNNLTDFMETSVFSKDETPVVLCLDEVDTLFKYPKAVQFFVQVRGYYNAGANDSLWGRIRWVLSTSTEPEFIGEGDGSPFNVADASTLWLNCFAEAEVDAFAKQHGLDDASLPARIIEYVAGRPYLTHLILFHTATGDRKEADIWNATANGGGVFREHLERYRKTLEQETELREALRDIILGRICPHIELCHRLEGAGLVAMDGQGKYVMTCRLYREYFGTLL